jgi:hypothetical protein
MFPTIVCRPLRAARFGAPARQSGYAMLLALVILVLGSLYGLMQGLSEATAQNKREDHDQAVLRQARDALIAYSALRPNRPGALPCPDANNDGDSEGAACGLPSTRTGRLPWRTLGLPDLRDSAGETLWYAVSRCFLERPYGTDLADCPNGYRINSDLRGGLSVTGLAPQNEVVAIIFAPGAALGGQDRSPAGSLNPANYLEGENGDATNDLFATLTACVGADCPGGPFNDKVLVIRAQDLFPVVENMVAKRLETEIAPLTRYYRDRWAALGGPGFFPFAVPFDPGLPGGLPAAAAFCGTPGLAGGHPPGTVSCFSWNPGGATVAESGPPSGLYLGGDCSTPAPPGEPDALRLAALKCTIHYDGGAPAPIVTITIPPLQNAGATLVVAEQGMVRFGTAPLYLDPAWGALSITGVTGADISVQYAGSLPAQPVGGTYTATITIPVYSAQTRYEQTAGVDTAWFFANEWFRNTYYAVVPQRLPGGAGSCTAGVDCLTVTNHAAPSDDKQAVLVLGGQVLLGAARPNTTLANYFEGDNDEAAAPPAALGTFVQQRRTTAFNDKVVVVAP